MSDIPNQLELPFAAASESNPQQAAPIGDYAQDRLHCMVDLETMSLGAHAMVLSIGAVLFDPNAFGVASKFYVAIDLEDQMASGRFQMDPGTLLWWMHEERRDARNRWMAEAKVDIYAALSGLREWFGPSSRPVWGNGASFDNVVLANAYRSMGLSVPWTYKHDRCFRTMANMAPLVEFIRKGTFHHALDDAESQAEHLHRVLNNLSIKDAA